MVKNRQYRLKGIRDVAYAPPAGNLPGIEVMSLDRLHTSATTGLLAMPQRPAFHHLLTLSTGTLRHTVDFTDYVVQHGTWLRVRPGQVQQWGSLQDAAGTLILFEQDFLDPRTSATAGIDDPHAPVLYEPAAQDRLALQVAAEHLESAIAAPGHLPSDIHVTVLRHLLAVLVLRLAHLGASDGGAVPTSDTFRHLVEMVERDYARTRRLGDYARALGYSERTLSRAALAAAGVNAKELIDRRVILEAKRLLVHSDQTAAQIAARLGFSSATNFSKFFRHRTGTTPVAFRASLRGGGHDTGG